MKSLCLCDGILSKWDGALHLAGEPEPKLQACYCLLSLKPRGAVSGGRLDRNWVRSGFHSLAKVHVPPRGTVDASFKVQAERRQRHPTCGCFRALS